MEYVNLGRSGVKVSRLCLGTMIFGSQCDEQESNAVLDAANELGINFIDAADAYPVPPDLTKVGSTEEIVGRWLRDKRHAFVVATKFSGVVGPSINERGGSRKHVIEACEGSLRRLGIDRIDLYYVHHPDASTPFDETLEALDRLVQDGKIHYVGLSNFESWQLGLAHAVVRERRFAGITALQPRYSLLYRQPERDLFPFCRALGIAVMPYNPLAGGVLTGRYRKGQTPPPESRFGWGEYGKMYQGRYWSDEMFGVVEAVVDVARDEGISAAQIALAWALANDAITSPIVGASRPDQLKESVAALDLTLTESALQKLDTISRAFL